jgi:hypothetical protein
MVDDGIPMMVTMVVTMMLTVTRSTTSWLM